MTMQAKVGNNGKFMIHWDWFRMVVESTIEYDP